MSKNKDNVNEIFREKVITEKLNKETLTPKDIRSILRVSEDTFENWLTRFYELYNFVKSDFKPSTRYEYDKDWHGFLLVLLDSLILHPEFSRDKAKQIYSLDRVKEYNEKLFQSIETYVPIHLQTAIKNHASYVRAEKETELIVELEKKVAQVMAVIQMMPALLRFQVLLGMNKALDTYHLNLSKQLSTYYIKNALELRHCDEETRKQREIEQEELDKLISYLLRKSIDNQNKKLEPSKEHLAENNINDKDYERQVIEALFEQVVLGEFKERANSRIQKLIEDTEAAILSHPSNEEIVTKVINVLDNPDNPKEKLVRSWLEQVLKIIALSDRNGDRNNQEAKQILQQIMYENFLQDFNN